MPNEELFKYYFPLFRASISCGLPNLGVTRPFSQVTNRKKSLINRSSPPRLFCFYLFSRFFLCFVVPLMVLYNVIISGRRINSHRSPQCNNNDDKCGKRIKNAVYCGFRIERSAHCTRTRERRIAEDYLILPRTVSYCK